MDAFIQDPVPILEYKQASPAKQPHAGFPPEDGQSQFHIRGMGVFFGDRVITRQTLFIPDCPVGQTLHTKRARPLPR